MAKQPGIYAADYRKEYRGGHGQPIDYYPAIAVANSVRRSGLYYAKAALGSAIRVRLYQARQELETQSFGVIRKGQSLLAYLPGEVPLCLNDYICDPTRSLNHSSAVERSTGDRDTLPFSPVVAVQSVLQITGEGTTAFSEGVDYEVGEASLVWLGGNAPAEGSEYSVQYTTRPVYEVSGFQSDVTRTDPAGEALPRHAMLSARPCLPVL